MILKPFMLRRIKKDVENELSDKVKETTFLAQFYWSKPHAQNCTFNWITFKVMAETEVKTILNFQVPFF